MFKTVNFRVAGRPFFASEGANLDAIDYEFNTPAAVAVNNGNLTTAKFLVAEMKSREVQEKNE